MNKTAGITGLFHDPDQVLKAAGEIRRAGYRKFDFHTPYPLHGLDDAMGIKRTVLPWISLGAGIAGAAAALHLQWWTGAVDYPLVIGGKPLFAFEPSIPITFELTVLFSAIATVIGMFALNGLPRWYSKWQNDPHFLRSTDDAFVVTIDAEDAAYDAEKTSTLLESLGAEQVRIVEYEDQ
jgi:pimeloyl-ACP methyl ester carboxylesterase